MGALSRLILTIVGVYLILDSFFIHAISYDYGILNIGFLDPFLHHWMWGVLFIAVASIENAFAMKKTRKKKKKYDN